MVFFFFQSLTKVDNSTTALNETTKVVRIDREDTAVTIIHQIIMVVEAMVTTVVKIQGINQQRRIVVGTNKVVIIQIHPISEEVMMAEEVMMIEEPVEGIKEEINPPIEGSL